MSKKEKVQCKTCGTYLTNPKSKLKKSCRECDKDVGMSRMGKGFKYVQYIKSKDVFFLI